MPNPFYHFKCNIGDLVLKRHLIGAKLLVRGGVRFPMLWERYGLTPELMAMLRYSPEEWVALGIEEEHIRYYFSDEQWSAIFGKLRGEDILRALAHPRRDALENHADRRANKKGDIDHQDQGQHQRHPRGGGLVGDDEAVGHGIELIERELVEKSVPASLANEGQEPGELDAVARALDEEQEGEHPALPGLLSVDVVVDCQHADNGACHGEPGAQRQEEEDGGQLDKNAEEQDLAVRNVVEEFGREVEPGDEPRDDGNGKLEKDIRRLGGLPPALDLICVNDLSPKGAAEELAAA